MREITYAQAGLEAVQEEMRRDGTVFYMSTDAILPLVKEFGEERMREQMYLPAVDLSIDPPEELARTFTLFFFASVEMALA